MASKNWFNFIQAKDPKTAARKIKWRLFITEFDIFIEVYQPLFSLGFSFVNLRVALRAYSLDSNQTYIVYKASTLVCFIDNHDVI